jgi:hypothetical protein
MPLIHPPGDAALAAFAKLRKLAREAGRNASDIGLEVWVLPVFAVKTMGGGRLPSGKQPGLPTSRPIPHT